MKSFNGKAIGIIGFGAQAKAWALNLRDSGIEVTILLREGSSSAAKALDLGFITESLQSEKVKSISVFCVLTPDDTHGKIISSLKDHISPESTFIYAHGYSFSKEKLLSQFPEFSHILLAPKAIASEVRFRYETKKNIMAAYSLEAATAWKKQELAKFANLFGFTKLIETTFLEESNADLFSEQSLLCSLIPYGALHSYNKLRDKGVTKELAFIECWMEVLLIAKAMVEHGPEGLFELISPNALIGGEKAASALFNKDFDDKLNAIIEDVWSGRFYNHVDKTDFPKLKEEVLQYWKNQEIQQVYDQMKPDL